MKQSEQKLLSASAGEFTVLSLSLYIYKTPFHLLVVFPCIFFLCVGGGGDKSLADNAYLLFYLLFMAFLLFFMFFGFEGLDGVVGDDFVSLEKSKKERLTKKLSLVNKASSTRQDSETGCKKMSSDRDRDNEFPSQSHSFKLPKKVSVCLMN